MAFDGRRELVLAFAKDGVVCGEAKEVKSELMVKMFGTYVLQPELQDKDVGQHQLGSTCHGGEQEET